MMAGMSVQEGAEALGVSPRRVRQLIGLGRLGASRLGRLWLLEDGVLQGPRRPAGRPLSAANAWALLALLSGAKADWVSPSVRSRLNKIARQPEKARLLLENAQPREKVFALRFLDSDIPKIERDYHLLPAGLFAKSPSLGLVYGNEKLDAYVSPEDFAAIYRVYRPVVGASSPNAFLRVPSNKWVLNAGPSVPIPVIAADLANVKDLRVSRAAKEFLDNVSSHPGP